MEGASSYVFVKGHLYSPQTVSSQAQSVGNKCISLTFQKPYLPLTYYLLLSFLLFLTLCSSHFPI